MSSDLPDLADHDQFQQHTTTIRKWLAGISVATDDLAVELRLWLEYLTPR